MSDMQPRLDPKLPRPRHFLHAFSPPLIILGLALSGWYEGTLTSIDGDPHPNQKIYQWQRINFGLDLKSGQTLAFIAFPVASRFRWPEIGHSLPVAARFKRHNNVETSSSELVEVRHEMLVGARHENLVGQ